MEKIKSKFLFIIFLNPVSLLMLIKQTQDIFILPTVTQISS